MRNLIFKIAVLAAGIAWSFSGKGSETNVGKTTLTNRVWTSGIRGQALAGPISPVERPGQRNHRSLAGAIVSVKLDPEGKEIARVQADEKGQFRLALPEGTYWVAGFPAQGEKGRPSSKPRKVIVKRNEMTEVQLWYDTGIR